MRAGAGDIVVADAHGNGENLLIERFPANVRIVRSWPRHLSMMAGIDSSFDAAMFIGYHASTHNPTGVRAHTFSSARLTRVAINGTEVTEGAWNAAIAGELGVPVVFVSGDDAAVAEVRKLVGNIEAVETKQSLGFHAANTLTPEAARVRIETGAEAALKRISAFKPYRVSNPVTIDVSFKNVTPAEAATYLKMFERTGSHSIRYHAKDMAEASDVMDFLTHYKLELEP
jgi:D-amino peptidase